MHPRNALFVLALTAVTGATARAQTPQLPRHDATIAVGWFGRQYPGLERYNRWHQSLLSGAGAGRYWTPHLKSEVEAAWVSHVKFESGEPIEIDGATGFVRSSYRFQDLKLSLSQSYQFGENAWVHPYLAAGADIDYLSETEEQPAQTVPLYPNNGGNRTVSVPQISDRDASVRLRPFLKGGFKVYASDRVFFITEWKFGFGNGLQQALWKTGLGVDF